MLKTTIPFIDLRDKTLVDLTRRTPDMSRAQILATRRTYGIMSELATWICVPLLDRLSHRWLKKTRNPYLHEIETFASIVGVRGVITLNLAYEWGCTSGAYTRGETISLLRILDWPFPDMGKNLLIALQKGPAGDFYNITWPALSGVFQGMAPGRFTASINQAPMRKHGLGYVGDWWMNRRIFRKQTALPPAHLLRQVFERASDYAQAKEMLLKTPIAIPAIFILTGLAPHEACIIERLEDNAEIKDIQTAQCIGAANEFHSGFAQVGKGFRPREPDSGGRYKQCQGVSLYDLAKPDFSWLRPPMLNTNTRLVMLGDAATGELRVQGFEGSSMVTEIFVLERKADA